MKSDWDMIEGLALRLVQGLEEAHVNWWVFDGWSFRKLDQLELEKEVSDGRGSENREREPQPEAGDVPEVEAKADDRTPFGRQDATVWELKSSKSAKRLLKAKKKPSRLGRGARKRAVRRGWR